DRHRSRGTNPASTYREILYHAFLSRLIRVLGPARPKPDRKGDFDALEAATRIGRTAPKECSKAIGAELTPKRINRQSAQEHIGNGFSVGEPDFARPARRTAEIGHRTFQIGCLWIVAGPTALHNRVNMRIVLIRTYGN